MPTPQPSAYGQYLSAPGPTQPVSSPFYSDGFLGWMNIRSAIFAGGAVPGTDCTLAILAAVNAAKVMQTGAVIVFPVTDPGGTGWGLPYFCSQQINLDSTHSITLMGFANEGGSSGEDAVATLVFTQGGAVNLIQAKGSTGLTLQGMRIINSNPAFTGTFVDVQGNVSDSSYFRAINCEIGGTNLAPNGTLGINLNHAIIAHIQDCAFLYVGYAIEGLPPVGGGGYSNVVQVENTAFFKIRLHAIYNAGECWLVKGCTFEGGYTSKAAGYHSDAYSNGPVKFESCWFGDTSVAGNNWIRFCGTNLKVDSCMIGSVFAGEMAIMLDVNPGQVFGVMVTNNRHLGGGAALIGVSPTGAFSIVDLFAASNTIDGAAVELLDPAGKVIRKYMFGPDPWIAAPQDHPVNFGGFMQTGSITALPGVTAHDYGYVGLLRGIGGYTTNTMALIPPTVTPGVGVYGLVLDSGVWKNAFFTDVDGLHSDMGIWPGSRGIMGAGGALWSGTGAPSNTLGASGDYYFRKDTPGTASQRIYVKNGGAWAGIL